MLASAVRTVTRAGGSIKGAFCHRLCGQPARYNPDQAQGAEVGLFQHGGYCVDQFLTCHVLTPLAAVAVKGCLFRKQQLLHHLLRDAGNDCGHLAHPAIMEEQQHLAGGVVEHQSILPGVQRVGQLAPAAVGVRSGQPSSQGQLSKGHVRILAFMWANSFLSHFASSDRVMLNGEVTFS